MGASKGSVVTAEPQTKIRGGDRDVVLDAPLVPAWASLGVPRIISLLVVFISF